MSIQLNAISKSFATHSLFQDVTLQIGAKRRIGLIGRNGCGKSTLLKILMNQLQPEEGSIYRAPGLRINYLTQEPVINPDLTVEEELRSVFIVLKQLSQQEADILAKLSDPAQTGEQQMGLVEELHDIQTRIEQLDADSIDARIGKILKGLGFSLADQQRKTIEFSGGWQMRINLAKVLLEGADILLLDEPTNHLDLETCEWLEDFLKAYPGGIVLVSHDRHFLDQVVTDIAELENGTLKVWTGNYTAHLEQKAAERDALTAAHDRQQKELATQTAFVDRFRASATRSTQAKSREKQLAKIERIELPPEDNRRLAIRFPTPIQSGREVVSIQKLGKSFGDKHLFSNLAAELERGQRVFLLGANGCGKTTLLKLILGLEKPDSGSIRFGHNVVTGYFSQNQLETLDANLSIFDTMREACPKMDNTEVRTLLGRFLFSGEQVFKPVSVLSGGEKSKLALAKLMTSGPNTLLLDEPTNHMDIPAKEVITEALLDFEGSMLCISHDRYFIQTLATHIWEVYNGHLITYSGDYDYYLFKRGEMRAKIDAQIHAQRSKVVNPPAVESEAQVKASIQQENFAAKKEVDKRIKKIEKQIIKLETDIESLQAQLLDPALQTDYQKLQQITLDIEARQSELTTLNSEWLTLANST